MKPRLPSETLGSIQGLPPSFEQGYRRRMGRKSRTKADKSTPRNEEKAKIPPDSSKAQSSKEKATVNSRVAFIDNAVLFVEIPLAIIAALTVAMVALKFEMDVNRVFDVPKALYLKTGGCLIFIIWLAYGCFFGFAWKSIKLFFAPVCAVMIAVAISTVLSIDPWMSWAGVYERQFGLQGMLSCFGLFVVTATCLRTRERAFLALVVIMVLGAVISAHAYLQSVGMDPWGFFEKPHNKVYASLGNATFAGNSLALIFPLSLMVATVATAKTWFSKAPAEASSADGRFDASALLPWCIGFAVIVSLFLLPTLLMTPSYAEGGMVRADRVAHFRGGVILGLILLVGTAVTGSRGLSAFQFESSSARKFSDAAAAGALMSLALFMLLGLFTTRTRGAWVGTAVAFLGMFTLLPYLFSKQPALFKRVRNISYGAMTVAAVGVMLFVLVIKPDHLVSRTIKSIPYAFMPDKTVYGQGQGTRPYLWGESPRVLYNHEATLERLAVDRSVYFARVPENIQAPDASKTDWLPVSVRKALVWPFGIGIETYRYAFMSHKSKKLEALDPMTNHDNPHNNYLYLLASCGIVGLLAYLWLLWRLLSSAWYRFRNDEDVADRAIAFGVVLSFFSYSVYSIAGFDSVASSVFLYFILGTAATYFAPSDTEKRKSIITHIREQFAQWRGQENARFAAPVPPVALVIVLIISLPFASAIQTIQRLHKAEQAFVEPARSMQDKIANTKRAIAINPEESYYRQNLGSSYRRASSQYRQAAAKARKEGDNERAATLLKSSRDYVKKAQNTLYASLNHAWAPENIFISLFQLYYSWNRSDEAIESLEFGLSHSPHLAPVRANLAVLKLNHTQDYEAALADALWVLDVKTTNVHALRTAGRCYHKLGNFKKAKRYLHLAEINSKRDRLVARYSADLEADIAKAAALTSTVQ